MSRSSPSQAFQDELSSKVFSLDTRLDNKTGQYVIRWKDIQQVCNNASYVTDGDVVVSFMTDDDLEDLIPLRIAYHADTVLRVIGKNPGANSITSQDLATVESGLFSPSVHDSTPNPTLLNDSDNDNNDDDAVGDRVQLLQITDLSTACDQATDTSLVQHASDMTSEGRSSLLAYNNLYTSFLEAIESGQEKQAVKIEAAMGVHFDRLMLEMEKNQTLQVQLLDRQQEIHRLQLHMKEKQDEILDMQQQTLNRLAIIQSRLQAIFNQNYELHEYPIPRLFIVLPKPARRRDKLSRLISQQFRLFFLCECGAHTMDTTSGAPHEIHLAKHEGYDIQKPTEFFQVYGPRVLRVLQWLRYGIAVAGIVAPALAHLGLAEAIGDMQNNINSATADIGPMLDQSIKFIETQMNAANIDNDSLTEQTDLTDLEVLEGADLRQLESFLKANDQARSLANLYRIVTHEGYVKWVCIDHYRANYRDSAMQQLREFVEIVNGEFIKEEGKITVAIGSKSSAKQFYSALLNARGIQELNIVLKWDPTLEDLRTFADAITKANIMRLTFNGKWCVGPALDVVNGGRRFNPLIQLMSNGRIQSLEILDLNNFFQRITSSHFAPSSHLRVLSIDQPITSPMLSHILQNDTSLVQLELGVIQFKEATRELLVNRMHALRHLSTAKFNSPIGYMELTASQGHATGIKLLRLDSVTAEILDFLPKEHLTAATLHYVSMEDDKRLFETVQRSSKLSTLVLGYLAERFTSSIGTIKRAREEGLSQGLSYEPLRVRFYDKSLFTEDPDNFAITVDLPGTSIPANTMCIRIHGRSVHRDDGETSRLSSVFQQYGQSIQEVNLRFRFEDKHALLLNAATSKDGSNLTQLRVDVRRLSTSGVDCLDRIITRAATSNKLERLSLYFEELEDSQQLKKALRLLGSHSTLINLLYLEGKSASAWIPDLQSLIPSRELLPVLDTLALYDTGHHDQVLSPTSAQWISCLISASSVPVLSTPSDLPVYQAIATPQCAITPPASCNNYKSIRACWLGGICMDSKGWLDVFLALDFLTLETLALKESNVDLMELVALVDCIPEGDPWSIPLEELDLKETSASRNSDVNHTRHEMLDDRILQGDIKDSVPEDLLEENGAGNVDAIDLGDILERLQERASRVTVKGLTF
ncbi:hypothetical protein BGZ99_010102 [Dissophora globulifera]|uniref:Uncharacterized protein n=1 Tax=Dissophora globulifera TaxID=979702 RepID=A0A9P6UYT1_9FUNG|nr:hypothetical protein BGZ99_010102 [Dissophora globulifera]